MVTKQIIARAQADIARPISSITVTAPSGGDTAILAVSVAAWRDLGSDKPDGGPGVSVMGWSRLPDHVELLTATKDLEAQMIVAAWESGAWDIARLTIAGGYAGALPSCLDGIVGQMRRHGWSSWTYRPMLGGPEIRQKAHGTRDVTLTPVMLGRGAMPDGIGFSRAATPGNMQVLKLGRGDDKARGSRYGATTPKFMRATDRQRAYIVVLRRGTSEQGQPLPASLTRADATAMIDRLLAMRSGNG